MRRTLGPGLRRLVMAGMSSFLLAALVASPVSAHATTLWVSVSDTGAPANADASGFSIDVSATGRFIAYASSADNLVASDDNGQSDVFVHDRKTLRTTLVSLATDGTPGNGSSAHPAISANGRYVAFESLASDLIATDGNGSRDVFVRDRKNDVTTRVSVKSNGSEVSTNGGFAIESAITPDGQYVAFSSTSQELVSGDVGSTTDIFVHDRKNGKTRRISESASGDPADVNMGEPAFSANGRFVAFSGSATNMINNDNNGASDVFVYDRSKDKMRRVSIRSNGNESNLDSFGGELSASGRFVAFESKASNLVKNDTDNYDVFLHDRSTGKTTIESVRPNGNGSDSGSFEASLSANGRELAFSSQSTNLVANDNNGDDDIFVRNLKIDKTRRVNLRPNGKECHGASFGSEQPELSAKGTWVGFVSDSTDLVPGDDDSVTDVFLRGPL